MTRIWEWFGRHLGQRAGRAWEWLGLNLGRRAGVVGAIGLLVTLVLGFGITTLTFTTSNADYLNKTDQAYIDSVHYASDFGGDPMAMLFTMNRGQTIDNLFTPANQQLMKTLGQKLGRDPWVYSQISPLDALSLTKSLLSSPNGNPLDSPVATDLGQTLAAPQSAKSLNLRSSYIGTEFHDLGEFTTSEQGLSNPKWANFLAHEPTGQIRLALKAVFPNNTHALFAIYLKPNLNINQESTAAQSVTDILQGSHFQNATYITAGVPAVLKEINSYLRGGILVLGGIAALVMSIILLLTFSVRWRLLPFFIVAIGLIWAFGLVGYFGIPLTLATIAALPVLLGVSMDYTIQMHSRIEEEVVLARAPHPIQSAARGLGPALLVVTFDAVFAFAAMWLSDVPGIRQFGSLLVVGIVAVCVCSIIATLAVLGIREFKSPTKAKDFSKGRLSRIVVWLAGLPPRTAVYLALGSILVFVGGLSVEGKLVLQTNPISWLNANTQAIKDVVALKNDTGSNQQIGAVITTDHPWNDQTATYVAKMSRALIREYPNVLEPATSDVNLLDDVMNPTGTQDVPPSGAQSEALYKMATPQMQKVLGTNHGAALNLIFLVKVSTLSSLQPVVNTLEHEHAPPGVTVSPGGISIVGVGLLENLNSDRTLLTYLALLFVGVWLAIRLRSVVRSLLSLIPVLIAVGGVALAAVALGVKLSPLTAVSGPLVVAVCTEFTSLMLLRFVEERNRGYDPAEAMRVTASRTGRAFMVSGMTAFAGVAVVASSPMPLLSDFGIIVALNVGVALLCALIVLPPILVWADAPERRWVSRGLMRPVPPPIEFDDRYRPTPAAGPVQPEPALSFEALSEEPERDWRILPNAPSTAAAAAGEADAALGITPAPAVPWVAVSKVEDVVAETVPTSMSNPFVPAEPSVAPSAAAFVPEQV
ncbi:MAG: efflux RND transporter permease subunit, partial [Nitrososphaerales archaeon]